jgi:hypothetical protein
MSQELTNRFGVFANRHKQKGIILDTNVLLLFLAAVYQPSMIGNKRLSKYGAEDGELLKAYVFPFKRILTTAHVLAETSNLARQIVSGPLLVELSRELHPLFCLGRPASFERCSINGLHIDIRLFSQLGLTDSSLAVLVKKNRLLLTDDLDLYVAATSSGGDAINFSHMREAAGLL